MAQVIFKRGKSSNLSKVPMTDGQVIITTDDGKLYYDYKEEDELKRDSLYSGTLTIGGQTFDGTNNITIPIYNGEASS